MDTLHNRVRKQKNLYVAVMEGVSSLTALYQSEIKLYVFRHRTVFRTEDVLVSLQHDKLHCFRLIKLEEARERLFIAAIAQVITGTRFTDLP